jgi:hypothetical protein
VIINSARSSATTVTVAVHDEIVLSILSMCVAVRTIQLCQVSEKHFNFGVSTEIQSKMYSAGTSRNVPEPSVPDALTIRRVHQDITCAKTEILEGIHVHPDEQDMMVFHAIIEGPADTPYAGGFFYFYIKMPNGYPMSPPVVRNLLSSLHRYCITLHSFVQYI